VDFPGRAQPSICIANLPLDKPLTDLYDTEGNGGFPGFEFKARPVVGGHFAFLALERACGGKAVAGLSFLDDEEAQGITSRRTDGEL
jgi:hypothetical protein